jgi:hypothetical protein
MFRAFLGHSKDEVKEMGIQEFIDNSIVLTEVLKLWHAPFQKSDE